MTKKVLLTTLSSLLLVGAANAQDAAADAPSTLDVKFIIDNLWILISAALVFIMHLGFASVEAGMCQRKNTVNIMFKNFAMGSPIEASFTTTEAIKANLTQDYNNYTYWSDFIFQAMFAATAATIVSGAVAERVKLTSFMIYAAILVTFLYPITGSWQWGTGWLAQKGFYDFAGSSLVHAFGGFAALSAVIILGPRKGKYTSNGIRPILPSNLPLANIGVFLLFLGWFGFNGGSVLSADPSNVSFVFVTTAMAGFGGGLAAIATSWAVTKKPDLSMGLNGMLAGLVSITAGADSIPPFFAVIAGAVGGVIVVLSVNLFDKIRIDDPVGAISVHGIVGIWGTLAVGIFSEASSFTTQLIGTLSISAFAFVTSFVVFFIIKLVMGVRVDEQEEEEGLDVAEHGVSAYN